MTVSNENWIFLGKNTHTHKQLNYPGSGQDEEVAKALSNLGRAH